MKKIFPFLFLLVCFGSAVAQQSTNVTGNFGWLEGVWDNQQTRPGEHVLEVWRMDPSGIMTAEGLIIRDSDTIVTERLRIIEHEGDFYYVADVSHNPAPVRFRMTEHDASGFTAENPEHDFPKKIVYALNGDILVATVYGVERRFAVQFRKVE